MEVEVTKNKKITYKIKLANALALTFVVGRIRFTRTRSARGMIFFNADYKNDITYQYLSRSKHTKSSINIETLDKSEFEFE